MFNAQNMLNFCLRCSSSLNSFIIHNWLDNINIFCSMKHMSIILITYLIRFAIKQLDPFVPLMYIMWILS